MSDAGVGEVGGTRMLTDIPERGRVVTAEAHAVYELLASTPQGLSVAEAERRLAHFGPNVVSRRQPYPLWRIALDQFTSPIIYVLLVAAAITTALGDYKDTGVILAVVVLNAVIGFFQEFKATRAMEALRQLATPVTQVRRGGRLTEVPSETLVPGDVMVVAAGARAAADARLVHAVELQVDESLLTGESEPVTKHAEALPDPEVLPADTANVVFAGAMVVEGWGEAVVVATGPQSELGQIAQAVAEVEPTQTPLQRRLHRFANTLALGMVLLALVTMVMGLLRGMALLEVFLAAVALAVSVMPEGLPVVVTVVLSLGVRHMATRSVLVRKLAAAETLGSVDVICSDKTGTITQNHMTVRTIVGGGFQVAVSPEMPLSCPQVSVAEELSCDAEDLQTSESLRQVLRIAVYCNNAEYGHDGSGRLTTAGSPTELALLEAAAVLWPELLRQRASNPPRSEVPFSSARKFMATVQEENGGELALYVKGAPEVVLPRCRQEWDPDTTSAAPLRRDYWLEVVRRLAAQGERVVAVARRAWPRPAVEADEVDDLVLFGLFGISDPPRPEAVAAIAGCRESGIRVIMVTGDHPATATAIARQVRLITEEDNAGGGGEGCVITGAELAAMSEAELEQRLDRVCAFARVTPHDKLRVVAALQRQQRVVAVTGDGVNDAPALRRADIGVAMGRGGTEAAREAADLVLLDDSFASIYSAVKVGRYLFENIRKVVFFLLSSGAGEVIALLGALALGWPLPFVAAQILWINLVTNGLQDVALAFEPGEAFTTERPPYGLRARIFDRIIVLYTAIVGVVFGLGTLALFHYVLLTGEEHLALARTAAVTAMVMLQVLHALSCRSLVVSVFRLPPARNPFLLVAVALSIGAQIAFVYWPPLQRLFGTEALSVTHWLYVIGVAVAGMLAVELGKIVVRRGRWHLH